MTYDRVVSWLLDRLGEPSTWAGLGAIAAAIAAAFPSTSYYAGGAAAICGTIAGVLKERDGH
jgi:hypothetical protein